ncbi:hypothetical protein LR48_Vigan01g196300 [Vigna angularis]|uniref:WRKY domain-containing protein n=1 Tax=Phaseolus angularis TaxID=3914 RepID=A0A0L9TPL5_PHAAN|nr:hypothetical protein LR48_Vigan01g196300 [Vigna angularis]
MGVEGPLDDGHSWRKYGQKDILGAMYPGAITDVPTKLCKVAWQQSKCKDLMRTLQFCKSITEEITHARWPTARSLEQQPNDLLLSLREGLRVQTQNLDSTDQSFSPFRFPLSTNMENEGQVFPPHVLENFTSPYMSPATSGISHFSVSPTGVNNFGGNQNLSTFESHINDMIPAVTSAPKSAVVALEFPFDQFGFDGQNLRFGNP